jgi:hypothetical protein
VWTLQCPRNSVAQGRGVRGMKGGGVWGGRCDGGIGLNCRLYIRGSGSLWNVMVGTRDKVSKD